MEFINSIRMINFIDIPIIFDHIPICVLIFKFNIFMNSEIYSFNNKRIYDTLKLLQELDETNKFWYNTRK